jgi:hypothetical protein
MHYLKQLVCIYLKKEVSFCFCFYLADGKHKNSHLTVNGLASMPPGSDVQRMVAMYDYDPQELSPNVDAEVMVYNIYAIH